MKKILCILIFSFIIGCGWNDDSDTVSGSSGGDYYDRDTRWGWYDYYDRYHSQEDVKND